METSENPQPADAAGTMVAPRKNRWLDRFLRPKMNRIFWIRLIAVAVVAYVIFGYFLLPCVVDGASMEPTYSSFGLNFCLRERNAGELVHNGDVVIIRYAPKVFYLKRVVGEPGDTIEFIRGKLYRNGEAVDEPYVKLPSEWDLPAIHVPDGMLFVVGDNRSMPARMHKFGLVEKSRIIGEPLW